MASSLVAKMRVGEKEAIIGGLSHAGAIYRMNAIAFSSIHKIKDIEVQKMIKRLKDDETFLDGYSVSQFAVAALDIMNIEKYTGDNSNIKNLIASKFEFLR